MIAPGNPIRFSVRFIVPANFPGAIVRITADTANVLVDWGIPTTVMFPAVDWWDYKLFEISRLRGLRRVLRILRLAVEAAFRLCVPRPWCGFKYHSVDPRVRSARYGLVPSAARWNEREVTVVHPPYLIPHLLRTIPNSRVKMVSALHMNLEKAIRSSSERAAVWYQHWVARERLLSVPRYTTSEEARAAAERLGIEVRTVIPDGVDLHLFHPPKDRLAGRPPVVTLYCVRHAQKGQADGLEALRQIKAEIPEVRLHALGELLPGHAGLFEREYGYLHGEDYADAVRQSDIFIYPSRYDGFPAPPLQALASGCALVTTAVAGVSDYAVSGENALVVPPGDVAGLKDAVRKLLGDPALRRRLQAAGMETAQKYDVRTTSRQLLEFLREVHEEGNHEPELSGSRASADLRF